MTEARFSFTSDVSGLRLDKFLTGKMEGFSRARIQRLIENGDVLVNSSLSKAGYQVNEGDIIRVEVPPSAPSKPVAQKIPLDVVYEDEDIIVVDKPAGISVHPGPGHLDTTLVNAILNYSPNISGGEAERPGIVHRLDKNTSGLIIIARHPKAHRYLVNQFKHRQVDKTYIALVKGKVLPESGFIDAPIGRDSRHRQKMAVTTGENGREARTGYQVKEYINGYSLLEVKPETGRTHQIRVHLAAIGHAIVGDDTYGPPSRIAARQFLHASRLRFTLPSSGEEVEISSPLPEDLVRVLEQIRA